MVSYCSFLCSLIGFDPNPAVQPALPRPGFGHSLRRSLSSGASKVERLASCRTGAYSPRMTLTPLPLRWSAAILLMPLLATALPASGATVRKARPPATRQASPSASAGIIPLPLNPIVPAAQRLCTARTPSGLGYMMLRPAGSAKPDASDVTLVNYVGYLAATGAVFDQGMRSALPINGVIPGFAEGLRMMSKTGVARFCIPAAMGYGAQGSGPIPANADLVFQVELVDFKTSADADSMDRPQAADQPAQ